MNASYLNAFSIQNIVDMYSQGDTWIDLYHRLIIRGMRAPDMWAHYGLRANSRWGNEPLGWFYAEDGVFLGTYSVGDGYRLPPGSRM